jgi:hypothetical protein
MKRFEAKHLSRSHSIVLNGPPEAVFPLFTPLGETLWVKDWHPQFLHPASGQTQAGMVFTTDHNNEKTYWSLIAFDPVGYLARYVRLTPASRFGLVEVVCALHEQAKTRATVTYTFTALSEAGNAYLEEFTEESYRRMIDSWQTEINAYLAGRGD